MSPSIRKKLLIGGGGLVAVVVVGLLVAPSFFDLNKYKPELVSQVKKATGRDLVLDGPVTLSLLPVPVVGVSRPPSKCSKVLLPEPEAPTTARVSPASM